MEPIGLTGPDTSSNGCSDLVFIILLKIVGWLLFTKIDILDRTTMRLQQEGIEDRLEGMPLTGLRN